MMGKVAIFGAAGPIGRAVAAELQARGVPFRVVGRTRRKLDEAFAGMPQAEIVEADIGDPHGAAGAARGAETIIYSVGVPYTAFHLHPKLMQTTIEAAVSVQTRNLVVVSSVYSYGVPQTRKVSETHPLLPVAVKGHMRKQQEALALDAQKIGLLNSLVVRLPDFYGPHAGNSLANPILRAALAGKKANWFGSVDKPHEFLFVPDAGPVIADLAACADCYGEAWNFAGPGEITPAEFILKAYHAVGREPSWRTIGKTMLKLAGWFQPLARELVEMHYLAETPVILDDSKLMRKLPHARKTPYDEGIRKTLEWMRANRITSGS